MRTGWPSQWDLNRISRRTCILWSAVRQPWLSPSRHIRQRTELTHNLQYQRTSIVCLLNSQCLLANRPHRTTFNNFSTLPLLDVGRKPQISRMYETTRMISIGRTWQTTTMKLSEMAVREHETAGLITNSEDFAYFHLPGHWSMWPSIYSVHYWRQNPETCLSWWWCSNIPN